MSQNIIDSINFLKLMRVTLAESVSIEDSAKQREIKNIILDHLTDYEVLSLLCKGGLPEHRYDIIEEMKIIMDIKDEIRKYYSEFAKIYNKEVVDEVLNGVDSIYPHGISTQRPILEHFQNYNMDIEENERRFWRSDIQEGLRGMSKQGVASALLAGGGAKLIQMGDNIIGGIAVSAGLIMFAHILYQRYLSKAAKSCKDISGENRSKCIEMAQIEALKLRVRKLKEGINLCSKTKNPDKCKYNVKATINKLELRIQRKENEYKRFAKHPM